MDVGSLMSQIKKWMSGKKRIPPPMTLERKYLHEKYYIFWFLAGRTEDPDTPWTGFVRAMKLFISPSMLRLVPYFCYIGFYFTFWYKVVDKRAIPKPSLTFCTSIKNRFFSRT